MPKTIYVYGLLTIAGSVLPLMQFLPWFVENGLDINLFIVELFASPISSFFAWDVIVSMIVLICFILIEGTRLNMKKLWIPIVSGLLVGVSCGLPLFLAMRAWTRNLFSETQTRGL